MNSTQRLIAELEKHSDIEFGTISTKEDGEKYRYVHYKFKYPHAHNWLINIFYKASKENGGKGYETQFHSGIYTFWYDRPKFKGQPNGKMGMKKLEILDEVPNENNMETKKTEQEIYQYRVEELENAIYRYREKKVVLNERNLISEITKSIDTIYDLSGEYAENILMLCLDANRWLKPEDRVNIQSFLSQEKEDGSVVYKLNNNLWDVLKKHGNIDRKYPMPIDFSLNPTDSGFIKIYKNIVSDDSLRPAMTCVEIIGNTVTGTNAHIMLHLKFEKKANFEDGLYVISKQGEKATGESIGSKYQNKYPNWKAVVPKECVYSQVLNLPFAYNVINNFYKNGLLHPELNNFDIVFNTDNQKTSVSLNARLLLDLFQSMMYAGMKDVKFCFESKSRAIIIVEPSVEWSAYSSDSVLSENNFGLIMPVMLNWSKVEVLTIDFKSPFEVEVQPYALEPFTLNKSDVFFPNDKSISIPKEIKSKEETKKEDGENISESKFLKEKIEAFEDMLSLTDDDNEVKFLKEKIEAFNDMLELQ